MSAPFSSKSLTTSISSSQAPDFISLPSLLNARRNAVFPSLSRASVLEPYFNSSLTIALCLCMTAACKGVLLCQSRASVEAPFSSNILVMNFRPSVTAKDSAVLACPSSNSKSTLLLSRSRTTTSCLKVMPRCKAVFPFKF